MLMNIYSGLPEPIDYPMQLAIEDRYRKVLVEVPLVLRNKKKVKARLMFDSGSMSELRLYAPFVEKHHLYDSSRTYTPISEGGSTGDVSINLVDTLGALIIGSSRINAPQAVLCKPSVHNDPAIDGLIGNLVWKRYNVLIDLKNRRLHLKSIEAGGAKVSELKIKRSVLQGR